MLAGATHMHQSGITDADARTLFSPLFFEQQLAVQSEQIKSTHSDVDRINEGVERASKQVSVCLCVSSDVSYVSRSVEGSARHELQAV